jgi:hypothetical protein
MMTGPGFTDALARFSADVDSALVRVRRIAADASQTSARFRRETRQLADQLRTGQRRANPGELTDDRLRRAASGFRADNGLPVDRLPEGRELLEPPVSRAHGPVTPATPGAVRTTPLGRRVPPPSDDDEDFSQERIMR